MVVLFTFTDKRDFYKNKFFMVQTINTTHNISDESDGLPMPKRIWAVVSVGFALCMSVLDINIVNIVLPTLSHDFGTTPAVTTWIINGYQLAIVISLLSFSALGEMIGYRKVFLSGIGLFCITSLICALSDSFWTLTVARIFQGFSASAITSVNTAQLRYIYPKSQIGRGMGINAMVVGIKHLPKQEELSKRKFDYISAIANAVTFGLLIYTLDGFAHHEKMDFLVVQLVVLAVVGTYYVRRQLTQATPLLPLDLLRIPIFRLSILTSICSFIAQMSAMVSLPFFLQNTLGHSEVMTGLLLTPWPLATLVTAPLAGYLVERIHPGILGSIGMVLFAVGLFSLSSLTAESSDISIILRLMLCGAGFGLFQTPNNSTIISSAPTQRSGGASGMLGMARLMGQTTGTTLVALLFSFVTHDRSTAVCLMVGSGFAVVAAIVSSLRLSQPSTLKSK